MGKEDFDNGLKKDNIMPENETSNYNEPRFCPKCGSNTNPLFRFCKNCGHQLIAFLHDDVKPEDKKPVKQDNINLGDNKSIQQYKIKTEDIKASQVTSPLGNEPKTKTSPKAFKIPTPPINNNESKKSLAKPVEATKQDNSNLNIDENIQKENFNLNVDENIQKENISLNKEENINLNVDENIQKENISLNKEENIKNDNSNLNIDENILKENKENIIIDKNLFDKNHIRLFVADEINKFHELKEKGIITHEEFEKMKKQLLDL